MADYGIAGAYNFSAAFNEQRVSSDTPTFSSFFGSAVAISGNYAIIGEYGNDTDSGDSGTVYFFELSGGIWKQQSKHKASDAAPTDQFGRAVAISGNYAIVGAAQEDGSNGNLSNSGCIYFFQRNTTSNSWSQYTVTHRASNATAGDFFGLSVAISGNTAIVGAYAEDGTNAAAAASGNNFGAIYIYQRSTTLNTWAQDNTVFRASNFGAGDFFGTSVAISGNYAIVGAPNEDGSSENIGNCGAAYIFSRPSITGSWSQYATVLRASNLGAADVFGTTVAISGTYAIVGATFEDGTSTTATTENFGAAYIFELSGGIWSEKKIIRANNLFTGANFGVSVAISGNYAIVGVQNENIYDTNASVASGAAFIYQRDVSGNWNQINRITPSNINSPMLFSTAVAVDGNNFLVGAYTAISGTNSQSCGAAYFYSPGQTISPTPLTFSGNTLTVSNDITANDIDPVSFSLASGATLYPFVVNTFTGTGTITYKLDISGGSTVATGTFTTTGANLLNGTPLTASGATTYILTLTANAAITYTIVGSLLTAPTNIISTPSSCLELKPTGTTIGTLTCDNPNNAFITYSVSDTANFSITGSTLKTNAIFDFESVPSYTITVTGLIGGLTSSNTIIISVTNIPAEADELRNQNLQGLALQTAVASQSNPPITAANLKTAGYNAIELKDASFTATELKTALFTATELKTALFTATELKEALFTATQLKEALFTATQLKTALFTATQLKEALFNATELKTALFTATELKTALFTATELKTALFNATEMKTAGYTVTQLTEVGYIAPELKTAGYTATEMKTAGYTAAELNTLGYNATELQSANYTATEVKALGYTATELTTAGYTLSQLVLAGYNATEMTAAGYNTSQLIAAGLLPNWNIDASANCFIKSYVNDFIDVSGYIGLRNNANLYVHGNAQFGGNLSLNKPVMEADLSFNNRIFVGGDISMNGKVNIGGNVSLIGSVINCSNVANDSVPQSAFNGSVSSGPDYTAAKVAYRQNFQANDDVSMNGTTVQANNVRANGNIVFSDGTIMNSYDNNIFSTNPTVFKPSTFTSLIINGNLTAGSYSTSSDYRIKTEVAQLDETFTVDNLRPVKYVQTLINKTQYGLIAHELQEYYPDLVVGEKDGDGWQRVNYTGLIAILINEIKRMKQDLAELEGEI